MVKRIITWEQLSCDCPSKRWDGGKAVCSKDMHRAKCKASVINCTWHSLSDVPMKEHNKWVIAFLAGLFVMGGVWIGCTNGVMPLLQTLGLVAAGFVGCIVMICVGVP